MPPVRESFLERGKPDVREVRPLRSKPGGRVCCWRGLPLVLLGAQQRQNEFRPRMLLNFDPSRHSQRSSPPLLLVHSKGHLRDPNICSDLSLPLHLRPLQLLHQPGGEARVVETSHNDQTSYKADNQTNNNNNNTTNHSGTRASRTATKAVRIAW
jgi:hypothetical protein